MEAIVNGRTFDIEFLDAFQGFRLTVMEYKGSTWQTVPEYDNTQFLLQTHFEALCHLASSLFNEAVWAEDFALALGTPIRYWDDVDCGKCGATWHYQQMQETEIGYLCEDCQTPEREN